MQAIEAIAARSPDLVFLDVQMPDDYAEDDLFTGGVDDITGDRVASGTARSTHGWSIKPDTLGEEPCAL